MSDFDDLDAIFLTKTTQERLAAIEGRWISVDEWKWIEVNKFFDRVRAGYEGKQYGLRWEAQTDQYLSRNVKDEEFNPMEIDTVGIGGS
jgi:hypothetical protein